MIKNKKGMTLGDLYPAILTIVLVGIVLGIGLFIMSQVRTNIATDYTGTDGPANVNGTLSDFSNTTTLGDSTNDNYKLSAVTVINGTGAGTLTNFTWTTPGVITWGNDIAVQSGGTTANITSTYTYDATDSPEAAMQDVLEGTDDFAAWIAIIVVVIAAAVVLGVVLSSFGREPGV